MLTLCYSARPSRRLAYWSLVAATLLFAAANAHEGHHRTVRFDAKEQHRPTPLPDRVVLTWSADPTTSIDVSWRTDTSTAAPRVQYARADSLVGDDIRDGEIDHAERRDGETLEFESDLGSYLLHSAHLEQLQPGTMYAYRVGDGDHWSEWFQFRTASDDDSPFTFVYFGDAQNSIRSMWSRVIREANQHAPRAAFMLHAGDLVNHAESDAEWGEWFSAGAWLNGMIPSIATPGNHEYDDELSKHWRPQFVFPTNGPPGLEETVYWLDYQGARIISLNSNDAIDAQVPWLEQVLSDPERPKWTIITFHHPIFSAAKERDNPELRSLWEPLFARYGVDLVLQGHDHAYARSGLGGPLANVSEGVRAKSGNTVYVVSVSGPKMYELQEKWDHTRVAAGIQLFQVIHVSPEKIAYEARSAAGELHDAFTLEKSSDGKAVLIEEFAPLEPAAQ